MGVCELNGTSHSFCMSASWTRSKNDKILISLIVLHLFSHYTPPLIPPLGIQLETLKLQMTFPPTERNFLSVTLPLLADKVKDFQMKDFQSLSHLTRTVHLTSSSMIVAQNSESILTLQQAGRWAKCLWRPLGVNQMWTFPHHISQCSRTLLNNGIYSYLCTMKSK